jgi:adenylate cyclase
MKQPVERRLTAILAADVAGYSRLMGADEEGTHERLKAHLRELIEPKIKEHRGRVVKNTGDGLLAEFPSVVDAVRCAIEVQREMAERNTDVPTEERIEFRVGINLGDVIVEEGDIFGDGVNVAARLEGLAAPGGICVSGTVRDQIGDRLPYAFDDMGEQSVKNIARPVRVYALRPEGVAARPPRELAARAFRGHRAFIGTVAAAALVTAVIAWWFWPAANYFPLAKKPADQATASATPMPTIPAGTSISQPLIAPRLSIVVLPFANLSNDPDQQYLADAVTEDLTTDLSRLPDMFVISRNTAYTYRNKPADTRQIGRELGVRFVLEGSVQRSGNRVRVTAQLIDAETDAHLWAERFDHDTGDLLSLQIEITGRIANALGIELVAAEATRTSDNPDALDYLLRGRAAFSKPVSRDSHAEKLGLFERALALDMRSVEAQSYLAAELAAGVLNGWSASVAADIKRAEELVSQALAASPRYPVAHLAKGMVLRAQDRCDEAVPEFEAAIAFNRNWLLPIGSIGWCKLLAGSIGEAISLHEQAIRLSPRDNLVGVWYQRIGTAHLLQSHTDEAIFWLDKARLANPVLPGAHAWLASAYALKGDTERAIAELAEARRLSADGRFASIARWKATPGNNFGKVRDLLETTLFAGLRKAGMPEE